jgi:protein SCO1
VSAGVAGEATGGVTPTPGRQRSRWPWLVAALVLLGVALLGWRWWTLSRMPQYGIAIDSVEPAQDFTLDASTGRPVSLSEFRGKPVLLYFGYTTCPDVCPTTLTDLRLAMQELGSEQESVQVLFVSVDPERDTADRLAAYLQYFNPGFIGLTGSVADIEAIASRFGVFFKKNKAESAADYLVDHTSAVLLLDADGKLRLMFPYGTTGEQLASDTRLYLR